MTSYKTNAPVPGIAKTQGLHEIPSRYSDLPSITAGSQPGRITAPGRSHRVAESILASAGIKLQGDRPWDIRLKDPDVPRQVLAGGSLAFGESYMAGGWECDRLDELFDRLLRSGADAKVNPVSLAFHALSARLFNMQSRRRAWQVGVQHYDLGNDFYRAMLDSRMTYTCGYWQDASNLEEAQEAKLELICRKLKLAPGMRVLDIGCGWGSFMSYATEKYGVKCVGVTISKEQCDWAKATYPDLPLEFRLQDYRDVRERFDRVVSVGMFEHVGRRNYKTYMRVAAECLEDDGLFLLHTIGKNCSNSAPDPWIDRYIFPNGDLPALRQVALAMEGLFVVEDLHNFGADYDKTLMAWHQNFQQAWPQFASSMGESFYRMWQYYLLSCAGAFRSRSIQLWQYVLSKKGVEGGYHRPTI